MLDRRRWLAVIVPVALVAIVELLSDTLLDEAVPFPWDTVLVTVVLAAIATVLARWAFARIDRLTGEVARRNHDLERRDATLEGLHRLSLAITATADVDRVLSMVVDQARALLRSDAAALRLEAGQGRDVEAASGAVELLRAGDQLTEGAGTPGHLAGSRLAAPLQLGGATIGSLIVGSRSSRSYDADDLETLSSLANQAAIAIENARLQGRLRELAVSEERERIAREMHDGLAQVLGYVNTKSQAVERLLDTDRVDEARSQLDQLAAAARSIYVDVREAILGLRSSIAGDTGLVTAVETYAARFAESSKLAVRVDVDVETRELSLGSDADDEVFRIVQEALTNVRKHAAARRVVVSLRAIDGSLVVEIVDDGRGLGQATTPASDWPTYGMAAMRERAARAGGTIAWERAPTSGTLVRFEAPLPALAGRPPAVAGARISS
jgi:signal transduction histidine kinase